MLCLPLLAGLTTGAQAQSQALVSNLGQGDGVIASLLYSDFAQAFTTGSNSVGYTLNSVDVRFSKIDDAALASKFTVTIRSDSGGSPGTVVGTLTKPAISTSTSDQTISFSHSGLDLAANTTYWFEIDVIAAPVGVNANFVRTTQSDAEDSGAASGWSIANTVLIRDRSGGVWTSNTASLKIRINGVVKGTTTTPAVSITGGNAVTEGGTAVFTLTASPAPTGSIQVNVNISQSGDFGVSTVTRTVTMSGASASVPVITQDDSTDEPNGAVTATVNAGMDYTVGSPSTASVSVKDNDDPALNYTVPGASVSARIADTGRTQAWPGDRVVFSWNLVLEKDSDNNDIYPAMHPERFFVSAEVVSSVRGVVRRSGLSMGARWKSFIMLVDAQPGETLTARVRPDHRRYWYGPSRPRVPHYRVVEPSAVTVEVPHFRPGGGGGLGR